jgi:tetratricopeptide (TPR) repeat protein
MANTQVARRVILLAALTVCTATYGAAQQATPPASPAQTAAGHRHYSPAGDEQNQPSLTGQLAPRLQNLGTHTFPVTTRNAQAQLFMSQGLNLAYAFNHAEAARAFREAARLDPELAMAWWGQALVIGPNINAPMDPADEAPALAHIRAAVAFKSKASAREQAYIDALMTRYSGKADERVARDQAYAAAMKALQTQYPDDLDAATLYVESVMDLRPWGYWMRDGTPYEGIADVVALTERVIARDGRHPGALHLYIHLVEATQPQKAEKAADALQPLMPAAGHMVHMPAHIYQRVGRYADAMKSNVLAIAADEDYITQCRAQGLYPIGYYPHNLHFLWFSATFDGQSQAALDAARKTASKVDPATLKQLPMLAAFKVVPYYALTRFGRWDEMLKESSPGTDNAFLYGIYMYSRGVAFVAKGQLADADRALAEVRKTLNDKSLDAPLFSPNVGRAVLAIAPEVLAGEIAASRKQYDTAIAHLERAVRLEDGLIYTEPAEWHYPPRHTLGAVLLEAGRPAEAETIYWEDLARNRENGWALAGLAQALRAQKKDEQAKLIDARLAKAWTRADVRITGSRVMR